MKKTDTISEAKPHTVKKFELIQKYTSEWKYKLLNNSLCKKLIFVDCMCNSGEYYDVDKNTVFGTGVRVANELNEASKQYPDKEIAVYLNDIDENKTTHIKSLLPSNTRNFFVNVSTMDASIFLENLSQEVLQKNNTHILLVYDPYEAAIDWDAVIPFFNTWGEVILNHMVSDSIRSINVAKKPETIMKYEKTYQTDFRNLIPFGTDRNAYEKRLEEIIENITTEKREFYISSFPFFIRTNVVEYNLVHFTTNLEGFKLFKKVAWQTFKGKSSDKKIKVNENQLTIETWGDGTSKTYVDDECYYVKDVADYVQNCFNGQNNVPLESIWSVLEQHPVFPSDGFKTEIKNELKINHEANVGKNTVSFIDRGTVD